MREKRGRFCEVAWRGDCFFPSKNVYIYTWESLAYFPDHHRFGPLGSHDNRDAINALQTFPTVLYAFPMCCIVWTWDSLFYGASDFVYNAKAVAVASLFGVIGGQDIGGLRVCRGGRRASRLLWAVFSNCVLVAEARTSRSHLPMAGAGGPCCGNRTLVPACFVAHRVWRYAPLCCVMARY